MIFAPLRARKAPHLVPMIATIGLAISLNSAVAGHLRRRESALPGPKCLPPKRLQFGGVHITWLELEIILLAFVLMAVLLWWLKHTQHRPCAARVWPSRRKAAALLGINVEGLFRTDLGHRRAARRRGRRA